MSKPPVPGGLILHGHAVHKFFVRKFRARDVASDGLSVLPGRQPYFDGPIGRNIIVQEGNKHLLLCACGAPTTPPGYLSNDNVFLGVSDNEATPLRNDVGLGGNNKLYRGAIPHLIDAGGGEYYLESATGFGAQEANWLWARASFCVYDNNAQPPSDDTVSGCINLGMAAVSSITSPGSLIKTEGEIWVLTSRFSVW